MKIDSVHKRVAPRLESLAKIGSQYGVFIGILLLIIVATILKPAFMNWNNWVSILHFISILGLVVIGQSIVMLAGGIDFSVAGVLNLTEVLFPVMVLNRENLAVPIIIFCIVLGAAVGTINALFIIKRGVNPLITTIAMGILISGIPLIITGGSMKGTVPQFLSLLGIGFVGPIPSIIFPFVICAIITQFVMTRTIFGRQVYAVGAGYHAARLSGVMVDKTRAYTYILSGIFAAMAGLAMAAYTGYAYNGLGNGYDLDSVAACVVGGISLAGGRGSLIGAIGGVILLGVLYNFLNLFSVQVAGQDLAKGFILIVVAAFYIWNKRR